MDCSLWFGQCRIDRASEIAEHFDMASLRGYFLGGSLAEWLREHGGEEQAAKLEQIDPADPQLDNRLAEVFGRVNAPKNQPFVGSGCVCCGNFSGSGEYYGSFGSWTAWGSGFGGSFGSYGSGAIYGFGGYGSGSFAGGSLTLGSFMRFRLWEWEWEWRFGSFYGSFGAGSLRLGSWSFGSWSMGSFSGGISSFGGSFGFGSYVMGSFPTGYGSLAMTADEYDRIMYECLRRCPLDIFGYGIHII